MRSNSLVMVNKLLRKISDLDFVVVCGFELKRQLGIGGWRRYLKRTSIGVGFGALIILGIDAWLNPYYSYHVAVYAQPTGFGPQLPQVNVFIPLWSVCSGYIGFSWMVFFLLLWARIRIATCIAGSINDGRRAGHDQMMLLTSLSRTQIVFAQIISPVIPVAVVSTALIFMLSASACSGGARFSIPLRVWFDVILQLIAVSAACFGTASLAQRSGSVLAASCATSLLGVSGLLLLYEWPLKLRQMPWSARQMPWSAWQIYSLGYTCPSPFANFEALFYWIPIMGLFLLGSMLIFRQSSRKRAVPSLLVIGLCLIPVLTYGLINHSNNTVSKLAKDIELSSNERTERQKVALDEIALCRFHSALAITDPDRKIQFLDGDLGTIRSCALFASDRFDDALRVFSSFNADFMDETPYAWLAACRLAQGRTVLASELLRFPYRITFFSTFVGSSKIHVPQKTRVETELIMHIVRHLKSIEARGAPLRATFLRWAVARLPNEMSLRAQLRDELRTWANPDPKSSSREKPPPDVRAALLREAREQSTAIYRFALQKS